MCGLRNPGPSNAGPFILTIILVSTLAVYTHAQSPQAETPPPIQSSGPSASSGPVATENLAVEKLPDAPGSRPATPLIPDNQPGTVSGTVLDSNGAQVPGALVALIMPGSKPERTLTTDDTGSFKFDGVEPGKFSLNITSTGFNAWSVNDLSLHSSEAYELPPVALQIATAMTDVEVTFTRHDIAEEQMSFEEKQRVLGAIPNFYVSYVWNAAPLSSGQKFRLALRTAIDPVSIGFSGVVAGVEQATNTFSGYGQGVQGYAKRFGASQADGIIGSMLGNAILPSVLHQDPRYFYKGTGSITSRALYAIATVVICKGDSGRWQPNYSFVLGNLAAAGISNIYYPSTDRQGAQLTIENSLVETASGAIASLFQEFLVKKISRGIQPAAPREIGN